MKWLCSLLVLIGRIFIAAIFLIAAVSKIFNYEATVAYMTSAGLTYVPILLVIATIVEILGGLSLVTGYKSRWGAVLLFLYLIPVSYIFHSFWIADEANRQLQEILFLKNIAIMGGLLYVVSYGAGCLSIDYYRKLTCETCKTP